MPAKRRLDFARFVYTSAQDEESYCEVTLGEVEGPPCDAAEAVDSAMRLLLAKLLPEYEGGGGGGGREGWRRGGWVEEGRGGGGWKRGWMGGGGRWGMCGRGIDGREKGGERKSRIRKYRKSKRKGLRRKRWREGGI